MFDRFLCGAALCLYCILACAQDVPTQLKAQADSLANLMYLGADISKSRRYHLFPVDAERTFAVVLFAFEPGNRFENWMAVFQTAEQLSADEEFSKGKFTLLAFRIIGRKSWRAVSFERPELLYDRQRQEVTIILSTTELGKGDSPNFPSRSARAVYKLKDTWRGATLDEIKGKP